MGVGLCATKARTLLIQGLRGPRWHRSRCCKRSVEIPTAAAVRWCAVLAWMIGQQTREVAFHARSAGRSGARAAQRALNRSPVLDAGAG